MPAVSEEQKIDAVHRLGTTAERHPELRRRVADARLELAAAMLAKRAIDERIQAGEKTHSLQEQAAVEQAKNAHAQTLGDLLRGEH
jgi:myo-inositol catabolism protein IolC